MAAVLGGEVGVERTDENLAKKYHSLRETTRRKSDHFTKKVNLSPVDGAARTGYAKTETPEGYTVPETRTIKPVSYRERVKMDFLAAGDDHRIKTKASAFAGLFSFMFPVKDRLNPAFITEGDAFFFKHIENLVISVRGLMAINRKNDVNRIKNPLYAEILSVIMEWDIENLHHDLNHLQRNPRNLLISHTSDLCRLIYLPLLRLINMDVVAHIGKALKHVYEYDLAGVQKKSEAYTRIKNFYTVASAETPFVFKELRFRLYPLLLKHTSDHFETYDNFFKNRFENIIAFLSLDKRKIVREKAETASAENEKPEAAETADLELIPEEMPEQVLKGLALLDTLFPEAGFGEITVFPDFFAYFHPLFSYSKGVELIPPQDPLHQVIILLSIAQEFFYGFRSIEFGDYRDERENIVKLQERIDGLTDSWHLYIDDLVIKQYCPKLYDYCRQIERSPSSASSEYGLKLSSDLIWIKRIYFLPHITFQTYAGRKPTFTGSVPKLHEEVIRFKELLETLLHYQTEASSESTAPVKNPKEEILFEIETPVSRRLRSVMSAEKEGPVNITLVRYTLAVITVLDYLINNEFSFFYKTTPGSMYRCDPSRNDLPMYATALLDPLAIFQKHEGHNWREAEPIDEETGFFTKIVLMDKIKEFIRIYLREKKSFCLINVTVHLEEDEEEKAIFEKKLTYVIRQTIRDFSDIPFTLDGGHYLIILPDTLKEDALRFTIRLMTALNQADAENPRPKPVSVSVMDFQKTWGPEKAVRMIQAAAAERVTEALPAILMYNPQKNAFENIKNTLLA